jgi:hypothetical protein
MNLMSKHVIAMATTFFVGASLLSPALAASSARAKQMRTTAVEKTMPVNAFNQYGNGSLSNDRLNMMSGQDYRCLTDDGYGRYMTCDYSGN